MGTVFLQLYLESVHLLGQQLYMESVASIGTVPHGYHVFSALIRCHSLGQQLYKGGYL